MYDTYIYIYIHIYIYIYVSDISMYSKIIILLLLGCLINKPTY